MHSTSRRILALSAGIVTASLALAGCATASTPAPAASSAAAGAGAVDLAGAGCPATVVIQTDWNPEAEHGHLYQLLGSSYTVDASKKSVSGPLMANGQPTGVNVEIRSGGPAIGFQTVTSQMYTDTSITLGYVSTDEAIQLSAKTPVVGVFAPLDKTPQMIMWDPAKYPSVTDIPSLGKALAAAGGVVRYFGGAAYMEYLKSSGALPASVIDGSYDGTPANFVAAQGKDAQQGFASAEPYIYQNEVTSWGKPVKYSTIDTAGWNIYSSAMSVRKADLTKLTPCLTKLVPVLQQAEVDYFKSPAATNKLILDLVSQFNNGWVYSQGVADYAVKTMVDTKLVGNGTDSTIGNFDATRMSDFLKLATPVFNSIGSAPAAGLTATDLYTNSFIDTKIGLG